jgi:methionyl-tRNA formyltransferase
MGSAHPKTPQGLESGTQCDRLKATKNSEKKKKKRAKKMTTRLPVVVFGTDGVASRMIEELARREIFAVSVICPSDRPSGRGMLLAECSAKATARSLSLPVVHEVPINTPFRMPPPPLPPLSGPSLGVVASFGHFLPAQTLASFSLGVLNMHPSLLPRHAGAAPVQGALLAGDTKTGVTVQWADPVRIDSGGILAQEAVGVGSMETHGPLQDRLARLGAKLTADTAEALARGVKPTLLPAPEGITPSRAPKPDRGLSKLTQSLTVASAYNRWRAFKGNMGLKAAIAGSTVELADTVPADGQDLPRLDALFGSTSGTVAYDKLRKCLAIRLTDGWLLASKVQIPGKPVWASPDYANHFKLNRPGAKAFLNV